MIDERAELLEIYRSTPVVLRALLRNVPDETLRATGSGEESWSVVEIVCHLRDAEKNVLGRVRKMRDEDNPFLAAYDQAKLAEESNYRAQSLAQALDEFEQVRTEQIRELEALAPDQWQRPGQHEEAGQITIQSLTTHMAAHDVIHLAQISRRILERTAIT